MNHFFATFLKISPFLKIHFATILYNSTFCKQTYPYSYFSHVKMEVRTLKFFNARAE